MRATERIAIQDGELATLRKNVAELQQQLTEANIRIVELIEDGELATLRKNVAELQQQLTEANIRIVELIAENKNKQEALLDVSRILKGGATNMKKKKT